MFEVTQLPAIGKITECPHCHATEGSYTFIQYVRSFHIVEGQYDNGDTEYIDDKKPDLVRNGALATCSECGAMFRVQGDKKFR